MTTKETVARLHRHSLRLKNLGSNERGPYTSSNYAPVGKWNPARTKLKMCEVGYHVCSGLDVYAWSGSVVWIVQVPRKKRFLRMEPSEAPKECHTNFKRIAVLFDKYCTEVITPTGYDGYVDYKFVADLVNAKLDELGYD